MSANLPRATTGSKNDGRRQCGCVYFGCGAESDTELGLGQLLSRIRSDTAGDATVCRHVISDTRYHRRSLPTSVRCEVHGFAVHKFCWFAGASKVAAQGPGGAYIGCYSRARIADRVISSRSNPTANASWRSCGGSSQTGHIRDRKQNLGRERLAWVSTIYSLQHDFT